ncbi:hypothetical protein CF326_g1703 [Tilletia indica]|nr:hypothetical protein CF326_g1703 [Tilletia indica]
MPQLMQLLELAARFGVQQIPDIRRPTTSDGKFEAIFAALGGDPTTVEAPRVEHHAHMRNILEKLSFAFSAAPRDTTAESIGTSPYRMMDRQTGIGHTRNQRNAQSHPYPRTSPQRPAPSASFYPQIPNPSAVPQMPHMNGQAHMPSHNNFAFNGDATFAAAPAPPSTPPPRPHHEFQSPTTGAPFNSPAGNCMFSGATTTGEDLCLYHLW